MPAKNAIKNYLENSYYHLYNRGVEKRQIFLDQQDINVFLSYLKDYLTNKDPNHLRTELSRKDLAWIEKDKVLRKLHRNNFHEDITLLCYCLMPNHFHLLVKQKNQYSIDRFMRSIGTRYTMYFNKKYSRVGSLYQSVYKAVLIETDEQLLHLSRYIHQQAIKVENNQLKQQPSSFPYYIGKENCDWVDKQVILSSFDQNSNNPLLNYEGFVLQEAGFPLNQKLLLDNEAL